MRVGNQSKLVILPEVTCVIINCVNACMLLYKSSLSNHVTMVAKKAFATITSFKKQIQTGFGVRNPILCEKLNLCFVVCIASSNIITVF